MRNITIALNNGVLNICRDGISKEFTVTNKLISKMSDEFSEWQHFTNKFKYDGTWSRDSYLENADIPTFSNVFYDTCFILGTIPTPEQLFNEYFKRYCKDNGDGTFKFTVAITRGEHGKPLPKLDTLYIGALQHRITRCYASFIREISALYTLIILSNNSIFSYSSEEDIFKDTDIIGENKGKRYSISLYNKSRSSSIHRTEKEFCSEGKMADYCAKIKVEADVFNKINTKDIGIISVYSDSALKKVVDIVDSEKTGIFLI